MKAPPGGKIWSRTFGQILAPFYHQERCCAFSPILGSIACKDTYLDTYHMGAREYDPSLGRWLSADTIVPDPANPQSLNRYSYVYNNPLKYVDPTGHDGECLTMSCEDPYTDPVLAAIYDQFMAGGWGEDMDWGDFYAALLSAVADTGGFNLWDVENMRAIAGSMAGTLGLEPFDTGFGFYWDPAETIFYFFTQNTLLAEAYSQESAEYVSRLLLLGTYSVAPLNAGDYWDFGPGGTFPGETYPAFNIKPKRGGETAATRRGRQAHKEWSMPGVEKEVTLPSGKRVDGVDWQNTTVYELKPNNPRAISKGWRQARSYLNEISEYHPNQVWTAFVVTYGPE